MKVKLPNGDEVNGKIVKSYKDGTVCSVWLAEPHKIVTNAGEILAGDSNESLEGTDLDKQNEHVEFYRNGKIKSISLYDIEEKYETQMLETPIGKLKAAGIVGFHENGVISNIRIMENEVKVPDFANLDIGESGYIEFFDNGKVSYIDGVSNHYPFKLTKYQIRIIGEVSFYKSGMVKNVQLQNDQKITTKRGDVFNTSGVVDFLDDAEAVSVLMDAIKNDASKAKKEKVTNAGSASDLGKKEEDNDNLNMDDLLAESISDNTISSVSFFENGNIYEISFTENQAIKSLESSIGEILVQGCIVFHENERVSKACLAVNTVVNGKKYLKDEKILFNDVGNII